MADIYLDVDDYIWLDETLQGNVNVAGLVFDDLLEESIDLGHETYVVWVDQIDETIGIAEAFTPYHYPSVGDSMAFADLLGGSQTRVKQSVLNVIYTKPVMPIKVAHMHLDVVMSGVDVYMEEVSDELQTHSSYANAVPYYWDLIAEILHIEMADPDQAPAGVVMLYLSAQDLVNMRYEVTQEYLFISQCLEQFFFWEELVWAWDKQVADSLANTDALQEIIGKIADDYLYLQDEPMPKIAVLHLVEDRVFVFDAGVDEKYYLLSAEESVAFGDVLHDILGYAVSEYLSVSGVPESCLIQSICAADEIHAESSAVSERYYICLADETVELTDGVVTFLCLDKQITESFRAGDTAVPACSLVALASESLVFADIDSCMYGLIIEEGIALGDVALTRWVCEVLIESGCDIADIIA